MSSLRHELIHDPDEQVPDEEGARPDEEMTRQERRWYILGALKSTLLIGGAYLMGFAVIIALMLWFWM
ncbi:MAG: hypothetical protein SOW08_10370 [Lachnospiraceae bacterium]|nr:hypothetical protein [Lachnospiraceae bacterium]